MLETAQLHIDHYLLIRLKSGDETAFREIYHKYHKPLHFIAYKYLKNNDLSDDALQDIFLKLWINRESLNENLSLKGFLFTSLKNHLLNILRNHKVHQSKQSEAASSMEVIVNETEGNLQYGEYNQIVQNGIEKLSPQKKHIFKLRALDGLNNEEVARELQLSINTVKFQFSQATKFLRKYLKKEADI
ncbi:RNA polymerase sigma-70 factor [Rhodocytophaga rosea]|uniref:RNA polymerase sigma-70 factor n=1 Tax=Rhodocytophaga rosea TaxID=2704465 RepID=A0A6C0GU64_9BACT|nr:RNA polymerase sigma-70 factor [Rhodocytophaga rosea]QHT71364.1 RNA polymerase sigma-70 factor [Rhodocytophaga rosea]